MVEQLKKLNGYSGSQIYLMRDWGKLFVRKIGQVERNVERLKALSEYKTPKIYSHKSDILDMEYIHGLDMKSYLKFNETEQLRNFILSTLFSFSKLSKVKDYSETYEKKLSWLKDHDFVFTKKELIERLPKHLPQSIYHGDFTLENIIHTNNGFYMIDPLTSEYDSYVFDLIKLRQDLECKWFLRNENIKLDVKLKNLQDDLLNYFPLIKDDNLLILILLRVYPYASKNFDDREFLKKEINRLWK